MGRLQNGYSTPFIETMLQTYGVKGLAALGPALQGSVDAITERLGEVPAQVIVGFAARGNGCPFCCYGHVYAGNLLHFDATGELFPMTEQEIVDSLQLTDDEVWRRVSAALSPAWSDLLQILRRQEALRQGATPISPLDTDLANVLAAWTLVNECSLQVPFKNVPPIHPRVARARRLQRSYRQAREQEEEGG